MVCNYNFFKCDKISFPWGKRFSLMCDEVRVWNKHVSDDLVYTVWSAKMLLKKMSVWSVNLIWSSAVLFVLCINSQKILNLKVWRCCQAQTTMRRIPDIVKHFLYVWFWSAKKIVKRRNFVLDQPGAARQINYDSKMLSRYTVHTADRAQHCELWWYSGKLKSLFLTTNTFISEGNQMQFCHNSTRVICRCCFACAVEQMIFYQHTEYVL